MALYSVEKGTPGVLIKANGTRKTFKTNKDLVFSEQETSGPFEGMYVFSRGEFMLYIHSNLVSISPVDSDGKEDYSGSTTRR